jgi:tetratricopeptide (TPR) repeat protein
VLGDAASRWGGRFRGSYETAAQAYARAFRLNPSAHRAFYQRVPALLFLTEPAFLRRGRPEPPDTGWFGAFPALRDDTIAFTPYPFAEVQGGMEGRIPTTGVAAVAYNRALQLDMTRRWTEAFPDSPDAHEALGAVLEAMGRAGPRSGSPSALGEIQQARALATDAGQRLRLAVAETRLRIKVEEFAGAKQLADSTLRATTPEPPGVAAQLAGLAALTGRVYRAAALARAGAEDTLLAYTGEPVVALPPVGGAAAAAIAFAALGGPSDSVARLHARLERYVESLRPDRRVAAHSALVDRIAVLGFPEFAALELHRAPSRGNYLLDLHADAVRGDASAQRARLARIWSMRASLRPGDVAVTGTFQEARVLLGLADTAAAIRHLDGALLGLSALRSDAIPDVAQSASLVRAMALRGELASRAGDRAVATWWARNVLLLWSDADPPLHGVVSRMRAIAGSN